jgi:hypothetical protein
LRQECRCGFSPGLASRLLLADGRLAFAKAVDAATHPVEGGFHRAELRVAAALPAWPTGSRRRRCARRWRIRGWAAGGTSPPTRRCGGGCTGWPRARPALAGAAAQGIDPVPLAAGHPLPRRADPAGVDALLAAVSGFWFLGAVRPTPPDRRLLRLRAVKLAMARGALRWLTGRTGLAG